MFQRMSTADCLALARRVCESSKEICDLLAARSPIDIPSDDTNPDASCLSPPTIIRSSLDVMDQIAHFGRLDEIDGDVENWARRPATKNPSKKPKATKRHNSSRENLSTESEKTVMEETVANIKQEAPEAVVDQEDVTTFNAQSSSSAVNVEKLCEKDKQILRPIFKHGPKLKEFLAQIEAVLAEQKGTAPDAENVHLSEMLERLSKVILNELYIK